MVKGFILFYWLLATAHQALPWKLRTWPSKIVGGEIAGKNELPYQVSMKYHGKHFCGGTILNENYILTAAHCALYLTAQPLDLSLVSVTAGEHSFKYFDGTEQERTIQKIIIHENYEQRTQVNDIALMKVREPFAFNEAVHSISLAPVGHTASGDAVTSGWGTQSPDSNIPDVLYKVTVPIVTDEMCRQAYGVVGREIIDSMICAGYEGGGKDSCQGDSGGPFIAYDLGYAYLAGIVSWGRGCALAEFPGVYSEISYFHEWILQNST